jgi:sulfatase maturation enzyme AslB (radical SAM superfamily)
LACTYCYEDLPGRPPQILTKEDIVKHVDAILAREDPKSQTLIVLFGGEPTLEWENVCFAMDYAFSKKRNVHFNMTTNGIKYLSQNFIDETMNNFFYKKGLLSIDVSFDGVGNKDRVFHNGTDSTKSMIEVFTNLVKNKFRYRMRYTIHKFNINYVYKDMTKLIKTFNPERMITSVAWDTLSPKDIEKLSEIKNQLRNDWINKAVSVPVCELFCDMCSGCGERKELKTYFTNEGNVTTYGNYENSPKFHDFKDKEIK